MGGILSGRRKIKACDKYRDVEHRTHHELLIHLIFIY